MAITGSGTEQDPYVVHNYTELKEACDRANYVELGNDIDCNEYGENFEWERIGCSADYATFHLDLKGHTIKNFKVKENDYVFKLSGEESTVKNGKILNAYLSRSLGFCYRASNRGCLENLSISINIGSGLASGNNRYVFNEYCLINNCAIYVEGTIPSGCTNSAIFKAINENEPYQNTDILLNIENSNGKLAHATNSYEKVFSKCRIRGKFNTINTTGITYVQSLSDGGFDNCVIDLETNFGGALSQYNQNCTGVINTDKLSYYTSTSGMTAVTSQEIISGAALRAKGFDVINVTP